MSEELRAEADYGRAIELLRAGRFAEGWPLYEARRAIGRFKPFTPSAAFPEWRGENLIGKRIVVCAEQGFGDQIMFGRYLPALRARGADVTVACNPRFLARLFEAAGYETRPLFTDRPLAEADYWTLFCSLPFRLGMAEIPHPLQVPADKAGGAGVGVMTSGSPTNANDAVRSLPPDMSAELLRLGRDLSPEATGALDFKDTAEIIAGLDLVITVDTAVAHLAGSMGKPTWILLSSVWTDWRWGTGAPSAWYPTARLFRQPGPGDWRSVLDQVERHMA